MGSVYVRWKIWMSGAHEKKGKRTALLGMLSGLALVLGWAEAQIPAFFAVPGMKVGFSNLAVLLALALLGGREAFAVNLVRICLSALLFGNGASFLYSLAGGMLSTLVMLLLHKSRRFSLMAVSMAGGLSHNIGQVLVAMALLGTYHLAWYLLVLWFTGIGGGLVVGFLGGVICGRVEKVVGKGE